MWISKRKLAELEQRVERCEKFVDSKETLVKVGYEEITSGLEPDLIRVQFELFSHDWSQLKESKSWSEMEKILYHLQNKHNQRCLYQEVN